MTQTATAIGAGIRPVRRTSPPDQAADARPIGRRPRNAVLGAVLIAALAVVVAQPQLSLPLVTLFGLDESGLVVTCLAVVALALPLAMVDAMTDRTPTGWFVLTRRNLVLSLTMVVIVATWYGERGLSLLPIGVLVLTLPLIIGLSRIVGPAPTARIRPPPPTAPRRTRTAAAATGQRGAALRPAGPHRLRRGPQPRSPPTHPRPPPRTPDRIRARSGRLRAAVPHTAAQGGHPHIHIQAQTLPSGVADIRTVDGPLMVKTLHTHPLLLRGASLIRGGVETRPTAVDPRRGDFVRPDSLLQPVGE